MKYAIIRLGGRQFKIEEGQNLTVDRRSPEALGEGRTDGVKINEVLLFVDGDDVRVGQPLVEGVKVKTKIVDEGFEKTEIRRFKAKARYRKVKGHKQPLTKVLIEKISLE